MRDDDPDANADADEVKEKDEDRDKREAGSDGSLCGEKERWEEVQVRFIWSVHELDLL